MRAIVTTAAGVLASAVMLHSQAPAAPDAGEYTPPIVPVHQEPHHRQVFQRGPMRILDLQIPPNDMSWFHSHEWPVLYVTLGTSATRTQNLGGEWSGGGGGARGGRRAGGAAEAAGRRGDGAAEAGRGARRGGGAPDAGRGAARGGRGRAGGPAIRATSTTSYAEQPITHRLENIGTGLFRAMVVINETQGDETTSVQDAGFDGEPELTNRWFRAYRVTLEPGQKSPPHRHRAPVANLQATAGTGIAEGPMTFEFNDLGQWAYFDPDQAHEVRNTGTGTLELIEVEVRRK